MTEITYTLIDCHTKEEIKTYYTRGVANRAADRRNLVYGAHRYSVRTNFIEVKNTKSDDRFAGFNVWAEKVRANVNGNA